MTPNPGFVVKLTDEERYQFLVARRKRDIVHGKVGAAPAEEKKDEKSPPFVDKVLDRALDYLRGELDKNKS